MRLRVRQHPRVALERSERGAAVCQVEQPIGALLDVGPIERAVVVQPRPVLAAAAAEGERDLLATRDVGREHSEGGLHEVLERPAELGAQHRRWRNEQGHPRPFEEAVRLFPA